MTGHITVYEDLLQGSDEWLAARLGMLTASGMKLIVTPSLKLASNDKERAHLYELLAQRITKHVEPHFQNDDMLRGHDDEIEARLIYHRQIAPVHEVGFIVNNRWGFSLGYSPDGLVGDDGLIECKSRRAKLQVQTILENVTDEPTIPADFLIQVQTGLLVAEREWLDLCSYSGGLPMAIIRAYPDPVVQNAIVEAAGEFERRIEIKLQTYRDLLDTPARLIPTERKNLEEMML